MVKFLMVVVLLQQQQLFLKELQSKDIKILIHRLHISEIIFLAQQHLQILIGRLMKHKDLHLLVNHLEQ